MSNTLTHGGTSVALPVSADWVDALDRRPIKQTVERSEGGQLIVDNWPVVLGQSLTIGGPACVVTYAELQTLLGMADIVDELTLSWNGTSHSVIWDYSGNVPAIEVVSPLLPDLVDPSTDDLYRIVLHFFEV